MVTTVKQDREFAESLFGSDKLEEAVGWIGDNLSPEDVFSKEQLEAWAERAGFEQIREER